MFNNKLMVNFWQFLSVSMLDAVKREQSCRINRTHLKCQGPLFAFLNTPFYIVNMPARNHRVLVRMQFYHNGMAGVVPALFPGRMNRMGCGRRGK